MCCPSDTRLTTTSQDTEINYFFGLFIAEFSAQALLTLLALLPPPSLLPLPEGEELGASAAQGYVRLEDTEVCQHTMTPLPVYPCLHPHASRPRTLSQVHQFVNAIPEVDLHPNVACRTWMRHRSSAWAWCRNSSILG